MTAKIDGTNGVLQQYDYQTPTTGFSYTFAAGTTVLVMNPAGTLATGTITMPAAPVDGMTISFSSTQAITALTVNGNTGQSIVGAPTALLAGGAATFVYRLSNTTWYTQINTTVGASAPVVTVYTSPSPWTKSPALKQVKVTVVGGGGSGGAASQNTPTGIAASGGGGGGGGIGWFPAPSIPGPLTVTVGAGGASVSNPGPQASSNGNTGNTSSFGSLLTVTGGAGGNAQSTTGTPIASANGASAGGAYATTTSTLTIIGYASLPASGSPTAPGTYGSGANSAFTWGQGGAGAFSATTITASAGGGYGSGGGGATGAPNRSAGSINSGAGAGGIVIVEEFY